MNNFIVQTEKVVSFFLVIISMIFTGLQVFFRYVLNNPLAWTEELARIALIWLVFWGSAIAFGKNEHLTLTIFTEKLGKKAKYYLSILSHCIVLIFISIMVITGYQVLILTGYIGTPALGISNAWIYIIVPISGILMIYRIVLVVIEERRKYLIK